MMCFSRDNDILPQLSQRTHMQVPIKGKQPTPENSIIFPPSGVIPFHGFTMYGKIFESFKFWNFQFEEFDPVFTSMV